MPDCAKCGQPLKEGASFCAQCGAAVRYCPKCGQQLKEGASFCAQCGAAVAESSLNPQTPASPPAPYAGANPAQAATTAWVNFTVVDYSGFFGQVTNTIVVDGNEVRTVQIGETVVFQVPPGAHEIQLVQVYHSAATLNIPITRKSNLLQFTVAPGTQAVVAAEYGYILGKFSLSLK
ncbi:MAG TPA: zinc ribbon domain-containing protein [Terracidiphilus sp.]